MRRTSGGRTVLFFLLLPLLTGCSTILDAGDTEVRLLNDTGRVLTEIELGPGSEAFTFDRLEPGEATSFVEVEKAFPNPFIEAVVDGETQRLQPIDHLPEEQLDPGARYTYVVGFHEPSGTLTLAEVRRED